MQHDINVLNLSTINIVIGTIYSTNTGPSSGIIMEDQSNYTIFRDCLSGPIIQKLLLNPVKKPVPRRAKGRKNSAAIVDNTETSNNANDQEAANDCADFVDVDILNLSIPGILPSSQMTLQHAKQNFISVYSHRGLLFPASRPADALLLSDTKRISACGKICRSNRSKRAGTDLRRPPPLCLRLPRSLWLTHRPKSPNFHPQPPHSNLQCLYLLRNSPTPSLVDDPRLRV